MTLESEDLLTLGQRLKNAREALNLSTADAAAQTTLKQSHIECLEKDIFILSAIPSMFVRGYVRTYLRFLNLPETWVNDADYGEASSTISETLKNTRKVSNPKSQARWLKFFTWLVLLSAIGMSVAWWWQEYQKALRSQEHIVSAVVEKENTQLSAPSLAAATGPQINVSEVKALETTNPEVEVKASDLRAVVTTEVSTAEKIVSATNLSNQQTQVVTPSENLTKLEGVQTAAITLTEAKPEENQPNAVTSLNTTNSEVQSQSPTEVSATNVDPAITDELHIIIHTDQSWISVSNNKKRRLAEKLYNEGEVIKLNSYGEYNLTIGAPANVKIYYKGQEIPLKIDGRIAKIRLPVAQ